MAVPGRSRSLMPKASITPGANNNSSYKNENRVVINVGGIRYETYKSTLKNIPDTRLSWLTETTEQNADYDPETGEYFFDRHPGIFNMILNYYRTGRLHVPIDVCGPLFEEELAFWGIDEKQIEPCCWGNYRTHRDAQETLKELEGNDDGDISDEEDSSYVAQRFGIQEDVVRERTLWQRLQPKIWSLLEDPNSSRGAQALAMISVLFILLSIATFCMETHLTFRVPINDSIPLNNSWTRIEKGKYSKPHIAIEVLDFVCIAYFTLEFIIRLIFAPVKLMFFKVILNWVDLLAIIPFYLEKFLIGVFPELQNTVTLEVLKSFSLMRIFRIFKLTRHFNGLKILAHSIKASAKELILLILFLLITVLIFASCIYYAESIEEHDLNDFKNIPVGFWWAVVTMTTLGYGDMHPRTGFGYLIGGLCAVAGVLVLALPVPVIVNNFALYYSHAQARLKLPPKQKKVLVGAADQLKTQTALPEAGAEEGMGALQGPPLADTAHDSPSNESNGSVMGSDDSGIKTGESNASNECRGGISVIFTDEIAESPPPSPPNSVLPPLPFCNGNLRSDMSYLKVRSPGLETLDPAELQNQCDTAEELPDLTSRRIKPPPPRRRCSLKPMGLGIPNVEM